MFYINYWNPARASLGDVHLQNGRLGECTVDNRDFKKFTIAISSANTRDNDIFADNQQQLPWLIITKNWSSGSCATYPIHQKVCK